ncbi:MAG: biopolymer transporter ExbD [Pyrinomonadaceae bacterium]
MNRPNVNVTPLIDVLLVLLIIFMVVAPLKPSGFKTRVPMEPNGNTAVKTDPQTLVVKLEPDSSLTLNNQSGMGSVNEPAKLIERLEAVFKERAVNGDISATFADDPGRPVNDRADRTVFIKAARKADYGSVARVVDAIKLAGAYPISLQIDSLE